MSQSGPTGQSGPGPSPRVVEGWVSLRDVMADGQRRLAAAVAALEGWHVTFLGRDLPAADIALAARTLEARMVAVSTVDPSALERARGELGRLVGALPHDIAVFVGGAPAGAVVDGIDDLRVHAVGSLRGFRDALRQMPVPA